MAIYVPQILGYEPFYIQKDGASTATNILTAYGVIVKDSGYPMNRKVKQPYANHWNDRDGDDEWNTRLYYEAFTYNLECAIFVRNSNGDDAARAELETAVRAFENFIKQGEFSFFSAWHKFGFQHVRTDEFHAPPASEFLVYQDTARVIFTLTVKVNDPMTDMTYDSTNNAIVTL